jgi:hypothetical protein
MVLSELEYTWVALIGGAFLLAAFLWLDQRGIVKKGGLCYLAWQGGSIWFLGVLIAVTADYLADGLYLFVFGNVGIIIATALPIAWIAVINSDWELSKYDSLVKDIDHDMTTVSEILGFERRKSG